VTVARDLLRLAGSRPKSAVPDPQGPVTAVPVLALQFHDKEEDITLALGGGLKPTGDASVGEVIKAIWEPSMRFGLGILNESDPSMPGKSKRLTYDDHGRTNNTCLRLDGQEHLFGERPWRRQDNGEPLDKWPGRWSVRDEALGKDSSGQERRGRQSVWVYDAEQVQITQSVELVPGGNSERLDTCLVRYRIENKDQRVHQVGLRFMLDTSSAPTMGCRSLFLSPASRAADAILRRTSKGWRGFPSTFKHWNMTITPTPGRSPRSG
jgi:hypothetical protein